MRLLVRCKCDPHELLAIDQQCVVDIPRGETITEFTLLSLVVKTVPVEEMCLQLELDRIVRSPVRFVDLGLRLLVRDTSAINVVRAALLVLVLRATNVITLSITCLPWKTLKLPRSTQSA